MTNTILEKQALRGVEHVAQSQIAPVGTFTVRRALPFRERNSVGPWVFLDHFGPFRVKAPARVVYVIDEPNRKGFAYGTLHVADILLKCKLRGMDADDHEPVILVLLVPAVDVGK